MNRKKSIEKRLSYLYSGELFGFVSFIFVSYLVNYVYPRLHLYSLYSFWLSFILLECLLLQGIIYWYVKLNRLKTKHTSVTPIKLVRRLHQLKFINIFLIALPIIAFIYDYLRWYPSFPLGGLQISFFIYLFAVLEYINYFHIQLSYDNLSDIKDLVRSKKLKKSCMSKDFKRLL